MSRRVQRIQEGVIEAAIRLCGVAAIIFVLVILGFLLKDALPLFKTVTVRELFAGTTWNPTASAPRYGMLPLLLGSVLVTVGALVLAIPAGVACATFLSEVAPRGLREVVKPVVELLAAIPSVVFGFVGLLIVGEWLKQTCRTAGAALPGPEWLTAALNMPTGLAAITGAVMLAIMTLPTIVSIAEDALNAVPGSYREGSLALGASRWQTIISVTLPAAKSGIIAAIMLGVGRAIGETMTVLMVTGNAPVMPSLAKGLFRPVRTMTATIAAEMGETAHQSEHYHALFMLGVILFAITFAITTLADYITHKSKHVEHR
jgi:phosphate transport system permease protein